MVVKDKNVLVFGSGISGEAACELLLKEEAKVVLYDGNDKLNPEEIRAKIEGGDSESLEIVLGTLEGDRKEELLDKLSLVVMSPGVPTDLPIVNEMREKGLPIWGEIELAYAIGLADPVSVMVDTFGTGRVSDEKIASWLMEHIDMRPGSITSRFELRRPIYRRVSCGGHFGENAVGLPWEWTDIAEVLQKEILS
jgi:hypothetical protein